MCRSCAGHVQVMCWSCASHVLVIVLLHDVYSVVSQVVHTWGGMGRGDMPYFVYSDDAG